jgi:predicted deacetylase
MRIAIRMDDITPDMDWSKFNRFKALLDEADIKPLIGVVPDNKDEKLSCQEPREDFWNYVKELQQKGWTVAMHGFNHLYTTKDPGLFPIGEKSEFAGLPYIKQDEMIREGSRILKEKGIYTDIFMAPSHSFDKNTLRALNNNGFYRVTDGFGIAPFKMQDIVFYPISVRRSKSLADTRDGIVTFVYHANTMDDKDFAKLKDLLDSGKAVSYMEFRDYDVENRGTMGQFSQYVLAKSKYLAVKARKHLR